MSGWSFCSERLNIVFWPKTARLDFGGKLTVLVVFVCLSMLAACLGQPPSGSDWEGIGRIPAENKTLIEPSAGNGKRRLPELVAFVCFSMLAGCLSAISPGSDWEGIGSECRRKIKVWSILLLGTAKRWVLSQRPLGWSLTGSYLACAFRPVFQMVTRIAPDGPITRSSVPHLETGINGPHSHARGKLNKRSHRTPL